MFGKIFPQKNDETPATASEANKVAVNAVDLKDSVLRAIEREKKNNPYVGVRIGGREVVHQLVERWKKIDPKGVHVESMLSIIGTIAGFSCQMAIWEEFVRTGKATVRQVFHIIEGVDGSKYYYGDLQNKYLLEDKLSVWSLAAGAAQSVGCTQLPDINEIAGYVVTSLGTPGFNVPRIPENHKPCDTPSNFLRSLWPVVLEDIKPYCDRPTEWPLLMGFAAQEIIIMGKDVIDPSLALTIIMECAIPSSKVDPGTIGVKVV